MPDVACDFRINKESVESVSIFTHRCCALGYIIVSYITNDIVCTLIFVLLSIPNKGCFPCPKTDTYNGSHIVAYI